MNATLAAMGDESDHFGLLSAVGLTSLEEQIYRDVVKWSGGTVFEIAERLHLSTRRAKESILSLEQMGLVGRSSRPAGQYLPTPPETALEILVLKRSEELERVRLLATQLKPEVRPASARGTTAEVVELIQGGEAVTNRHYQLMLSARQELMGFAVTPIEAATEQFTDFKLSLLSRGIKARGVCSVDVLRAPGFVQFAEAVGRAGEETRTVPRLPMPMLIVDRKSALVPVTTTGTGYHEYLALRAPALVDSLVALFEQVWAGATPFRPWVDDTAFGDDAPSLSDDDRRLLSLLAAGLKDSAIANVLGMGQRTVERRVRHIMELLGTQSRFQTGVEATRRGWLTPSA